MATSDGGREDGGAAPGIAAVAAAPAPVGERVRALRVAARMTQTQLAAGRFSKEYISQVERGKTRPTAETLEWLAGRLGTDMEFLEQGVSRAELGQAESALARAEALSESHRYERAIEEFRDAAALVESAGLPALSLRALRGEAWAHLQKGDLGAAESLLARARDLVQGAGFTGVDRADLLFLLGVLSYKRSDVVRAVELFARALALAERSGRACDGLRSDIHHWRSRCRRRQRDWEAAREDTERALELAEDLGDPRRSADAYFQASLVAERQGNWLLARQHAEQAMALFDELGDRANVGRLLNNLGGIAHLLGNSTRAVELLNRSFEIAVETGLAPDAGHALCSLAEVHLACGEAAAAERDARKALRLLAGRVDYLHEIGIAELTLGHALLKQDRPDEAEAFFSAAQTSFARIGSVSHQAAAAAALGDLAGYRGDTRAAARRYRQAAEALRDSPF
ncbi:Tetratricopeptide repeat [Gaiella occulta]|uniref:Tetratricopeptide repeat n=1 Tax=Gaiella occulta TaxID=1002870 RepID=A0A7M2Z2D5_9ACTN|nr:helix-turn-helix transcriptional regulator [Gaiella occulta]RDI76084.1 Tetratricopeptide repeat [Gaiella occulta]